MLPPPPEAPRSMTSRGYAPADHWFGAQTAMLGCRRKSKGISRIAPFADRPVQNTQAVQAAAHIALENLSN
jgi:hypothetical protein